MTREEIAAIDRECEEQHISQQEVVFHRVCPEPVPQLNTISVSLSQ